MSKIVFETFCNLVYAVIIYVRRSIWLLIILQ